MPLLGKINHIKHNYTKDDKIVPTSQIPEELLTQTSDYLELIGDFLKGCKTLGDRGEANPFLPVFVEMWPLI